MARINKTIYAAIVLILLSIGINQAQLFGSEAGEKKLIYFKNNSFLVELAETKEQQEKGLMFVKNLPPDSGMLFVYKEEAPRYFYMKNTYIPLDIIWMDKDRKVVFIKKNAAAEKAGIYETIQPREEAMYVLELAAGSSDKLGLRIGDYFQL